MRLDEARPGAPRVPSGVEGFDPVSFGGLHSIREFVIDGRGIDDGATPPQPLGVPHRPPGRRRARRRAVVSDVRPQAIVERMVARGV